MKKSEGDFMLKLEVLVATMKQNDYSLFKKMNINSDVLFVNQSDINKYDECSLNGHRVRMLSNMQRGLSKSRNQALLFSEGDICLIADDDIKYTDGYQNTVFNAFKEIPDADIIIFNTTLLNYSGGIRRKEIKKIRRAPKYKNYGSVRIAFRRESLLKNNIWFNVFFGTGSFYGAGEESLVLRDANKKGLKIYEYPENIAEVDYSISTWFKGYDEKYFYDKGAWLAAAYPKLKHLFKYYYLVSFRNHTNISIKNMMKYLNDGIDGYKSLTTFDDYI